jgi:hypothetical protein
LKQNSSSRASALHITLRTTLISLSTALLALAAVTPARNQFERKPAGAGVTPQTAHTRAAVSEPSATLKRIHAQKSARIEFSASRQRVGRHEISGFSARQARTARDENLIPPAGLKPVEQEAWLAMARRQEASGGIAVAYPIRRKCTPHCQQVTISPKFYPHRRRS